jgi:NAD(P)-dependent dehydrogenase (short-subunit alcohol dehydrogenase family)
MSKIDPPKKTFVISGCSTGIGHALALKLASEGHLVWAGIRRSEDYQKLVLSAGHAAICLRPFQVDLAQIGFIAAAVAQIEGSVDIPWVAEYPPPVDPGYNSNWTIPLTGLSPV